MAGNWITHYQRWRACTSLDPELRDQLKTLQHDAQALEDCFYKYIEFGTGGLRGELGPGINRLNVYTVRKTSEGLARYISGQGKKAKQAGVAIAYDSRHKSREFAVEAAKVLGNHGIRSYLFDRLSPTPLLSFAVRHLGAFAGLVITASHNPPEYNGYKIYGPDGGQIAPGTAEQIMLHIHEVNDELTIEATDEGELKKSGLLAMIGSEVLEAYLKQVKNIRVQSAAPEIAADQLHIVYTPLHGAALQPIMEGLKSFGYTHVSVVREQAIPDPEFSTVSSPNPEEHQAFEMAIKYGSHTNADVIMATDPDGDRLGVAAKNRQGEYVVLTGNQVGAIILHYLLSQKQENGMLPPNGVVLKTIVTSEIGRAIAADFGLSTVDTLTGFKYIGEKIAEYEETGEYVFQFGYEESYGFLIGDFVRDKDAVQTALILADACAYHKAQGRSLYDALLALFATYGFYCEDLHSMTCKGKEGLARISAILASLRDQPWKEVAGKKVTAREDYLTSERRQEARGEITPLMLPKSDVLKYLLEDDSWFCIRPSGTEPKIKLYFGVKGASLEDASQQLEVLKRSVIKLIESV